MRMSNDQVKSFALSLLRADSEDEVIAILKAHGFWEDRRVWRLYDDREGNYASIGNQQSRPEAALVEKVVNSVDARLMNECLGRVIDPTSAAAPQTIREAVAEFFEAGPSRKVIGGRLQDWNNDRILAESRHITIAVTGEKAKSGNACITIADAGEGQLPSRVPATFFSIEKQNKLRIPFVQGKFNMGGTGVLKFCGQNSFQLLLTKRNPAIIRAWKESDSRASHWSVSIVRRERPLPGAGNVRNSVYRYLAPIGADARPYDGQVMTFEAAELSIFPEQNEPYKRGAKHGSVIKMYEYDTKGFRSHALMSGGLLNRLETLLPEIALPVRVHECRSYRGVKERSFENTLKGLTARLSESRKGVFEAGYPASVQMTVDGQTMTVQIFALRENNADTYTGNDGVLFAVNGQTHGALSRTFFERKHVGMQRLGKSLIVLVDCTSMTPDAREDLFMNSRDRLSNGALRKAIEDELVDIIGKHPGLRELRERRRREEISERLEDSKPLEDVIKSILETSPSLARLFLIGQRLNRPHKGGSNGSDGAAAGGTEEGTGSFVGKPHPTFFRFARKRDGDVLARTAEIGRRTRARFETDVVNDYFTRPQLPGHYHLEVVEGALEGREISNNVSLHNGVANWSISLPEEGIQPGDRLTLQLTVEDETLLDPFVNILRLTLVRPSEAGPGGGGTRTDRSGVAEGTRGGKGAGAGSRNGGKGDDAPAGIRLPDQVEVHEGDDNWRRYKFDERTACHVIDEGTTDDQDQSALTFYINVDNVYLRTDMKGTDADAAAQKAKFKYANVLVGLALIHDRRVAGNGRPVPHREAEEEAEDSVEELVGRTTRALAPFLVPMIDYLGAIKEEERVLAHVGDEE